MRNIIFNFDEKKFNRQLKLYEPLKPATFPPIVMERDAINTCISGCKKIENNAKTKNLLYEVYRGIT